MLKYFRKIHFRIFLICACICLALGGTISVTVLGLTRESTRAQIETDMTGFTLQLRNALEGTLDDLLMAAIEISRSTEARRYFSNDHQDIYDKAVSTSELLRHLNTIKALTRTGELFLINGEDALGTGMSGARHVYGQPPAAQRASKPPAPAYCARSALAAVAQALIHSR